MKITINSLFKTKKCKKMSGRAKIVFSYPKTHNFLLLLHSWILTTIKSFLTIFANHNTSQDKVGFK